METGDAHTMTGDLSVRIDHLIREQIAKGRYRSNDEVMVEALETLRDVEQLSEPIRKELSERLASAGKGLSLPLDRDAFFAETRRRLAAE